MSKAAELAKIGEVATNSQIGGRRNIIINGAMQVAQRGTSATGLGAETSLLLDRFSFGAGSTAGRATMSQVADVHDGFANALKLDCTTADTSIAANEQAYVIYKFEGQELQQLKKGTSGAEKMTLSFYVKGNAAATYTAEFYDADNNRHIAQEFSVTTDWNRITLTYVGDTTGAYDDDNALSVYLFIWLHAGSNFTSGTFVSNTWASLSQTIRVGDNQTSFFDSTNRTFFITGVQMEVGSVATSFEHRSFGEELALCQRYYQRVQGATGAAYKRIARGHNWATTGQDSNFILAGEMRAFPTLVTTGTASNYGVYHANTLTALSAVPALGSLSDAGVGNLVALTCTVGSGLTVGQGSTLMFNNSVTAFLAVDSEL